MTERPRVAAYEEISPLAAPEAWDSAIAPYRTKTLFHETIWLRFLERSQHARIHGLRFLDDHGRTMGYLCAGEVRKGLFKLLGSPLQGWTTNAMGPIIEDGDITSLLPVLERYCRAQGVDYIELAHPALPPSAMQAEGYELDPDSAYLVVLDDERSVWERLENKSCRYKIRRAEKNGLTVERTDDRGFIDQYYAQLEDVFLRQGLVPTYGKDRVQELWECLMPVGRLLALRVRHGDEVIASGLFPFDERTIYFWGGASWVRSYPLYPNELMQWHVMLFALGRGIPLYNMGGGGAFKRKFGGACRSADRWFKPFSRSARLGRAVFKRYVRTRQRLLGRWKRAVAARTVQGEP